MHTDIINHLGTGRFVSLLDFKSHILFVCLYFPGAHMKCQVWFFLFWMPQR